MVKVYLELDEMGAMEMAATKLRDRLLVRMLSRLGCRISEILGLTLRDVDLTHSTVTIKHLKTRAKLSCTVCGQRLGMSHAFCPGCGSRIDKAQVKQQERRRQRVLPIDNNTLKLLDEYMQDCGPDVQNGKQPVFGINRHRAWQIVKQCAERAGLPKLNNPETGRVHNVSPHRLRDAFAVHAMKLDDSGDGLRLLQEHLGHQSFDTTAKYRKVAGEEHRKWYQKLWE
jgi:integrase/recombinase XerD